MIPAAFLICTLISIVLVIQRIRRAAFGAPAMILVWAALLVLWAVSPWAPADLFDEESLPCRLIVIDASESMGPSAAALFARASLPIAADGRLIVVAAGADPVVVYEGESSAFPDQLRPGVLPESAEFRRRASVKRALRVGLSRLRPEEKADIAILSDGGFEATDAKLFLDDRMMSRTSSATVIPVTQGTEPNLSVEILRADSVFTPGVALRFDVMIRGRLKADATVELKIETQFGKTRSQEVRLLAGDIERRMRLSTGPLDPRETYLRAGISGLGSGDARRSDDTDVLPLRAATATPRLLVIDGRDAAPLSPQSLPGFSITRDPAELGLVDVVLVNDAGLPSSRLSPAILNSLEARVSEGCGLFLCGSRRAFGLGQWEESVLDQLSPLKSRPGKKKRVLAVAIDRSGSMEKNNRFQRAAAVVIATFDRLKDGDRLELLLFGPDVMKATYQRGQEGESTRLADDLKKVQPRGGTDLLPVMTALVEMKVEDDEELLGIILSDGRDPESMTEAQVAQWRAELSKRRFDFRFFWFDRDPGLRSLLLQLVGRPDALVEVDDFGALRRPFFQAVDEKLIVRDGRYRHQDGRALTLARLIRTRSDPNAQVHVQGREGAHALATIRRGLGLVGAAPVSPAEAETAGLFPGDGSLDSFVKTLIAPLPNLPVSLAPVVDGPGVFIQLSGYDGVPEGLQLRFGDQEPIPLEQSGPREFRTPGLDLLPPASPAQLINQEGGLLARVAYRGLRPIDLGPPPAGEKTAALAASLNEAAKSAGSTRAHLGFLVLAFLLLAAEMTLRISGNS